MRRTWLLLVPVAVVVLAVTWIVEPNLIVGLRSPRALAWAGGLALGCAAVALGARRLGAALPLALALGALPGLVATALFVVRPIVDPRELTEDLPTPTPTATATVSVSGSPPPVAAGPRRVATGLLRGLAGHDAAGAVSTYRLADGSHVIRFENVDIGGTPDPRVYVLPGRDRTSKGGTYLGELKAEKGSFNYTLPAGFAGTQFTVLVWCEQFAVEIANATPV